MRFVIPSTMLVAALALAPMAHAQTSVTSNPAVPSSSQAMPEPTNSLPPGAGAQSQPNAQGTAAPDLGTSNMRTPPRTKAHHAH